MDHSHAETLDLDLARDGYTMDGGGPNGVIRSFGPLILGQMAETTNYLIERRNYSVPVRMGHPELCEDGETELRMGEARDFRMVEAEDGTKVLRASVTLSGKLLDQFRAGMLPKRSIGISEFTQLPDGEMVGAHLDHLALLGTSQPAYPDMANFTSQAPAPTPNLWDRIESFLTRMFTRYESRKSLTRHQTEENPMDTQPPKTDFEQRMEQRIAALQQQFESDLSAQRQTAQDLQEQLRAERAERTEQAYTRLVSLGRIADSPEQHERFARTVDALGLSEAEAMFTGLESAEPDMGVSLSGQADTRSSDDDVLTSYARRYKLDAHRLFGISGRGD